MLETMLPYILVALPYAITAVAAVLVVMLPILGVKWAGALASRVNTELSYEQERRIQEAITAAVQYAEEWAVGKLKETGEKPAGAAKLEHALEFLSLELERLGVTGWARDLLQGWILARLSRERQIAEAGGAHTAE